MKIEQQVCTLEQAKRLSELGIIQGKSAFFYDTWMANKNRLQYNSGAKYGDGYKDAESCYSAFTVAELGVMLPDALYTIKKSDLSFVHGVEAPLCFRLDTTNTEKLWQAFKTEAEARAAMLIHLLENNLITTSSVNERG